MPESFDSHNTITENPITPQRLSSFENLRMHFWALSPRKRLAFIIVAILLIWLFLGLLFDGIPKDPIDIVKNSYLSGYPNATMGEIMAAGQMSKWTSAQLDGNLYTVTASNQFIVFKFIVDTREEIWQLDSLSANGLSLPVSEAGNFLNGWYIAAQR